MLNVRGSFEASHHFKIMSAEEKSDNLTIYICFHNIFS